MNSDVHFYIDNAPPQEVVEVLHVLSDGIERTRDQIADDLLSKYSFKMQKDLTYSPRRLVDLGLAEGTKDSNKIRYRLTKIGQNLASIVSQNRSLALELLHYLHFTPFAGAPPEQSIDAPKITELRKYLWSYRRCCVRVWSTRAIPNVDQLAGEILTEMVVAFPTIDFTQFSSESKKRPGGRFDGRAVDRVMSWLRALEPSPLPKERNEKRLVPRDVDHVELALLALDDLYRARGYTYGDPVIMDEAVVRQAAGVFFLDEACCTRLIQLAARLFPRRLTVRSTLEGAMLILHGPYTVLDVASSLGLR